MKQPSQKKMAQIEDVLGGDNALALQSKTSQTTTAASLEVLLGRLCRRLREFTTS